MKIRAISGSRFRCNQSMQNYNGSGSVVCLIQPAPAADRACEACSVQPQLGDVAGFPLKLV
jgi:hypothetical protein